jgi:hypothetical protein
MGPGARISCLNFQYYLIYARPCFPRGLSADDRHTMHAIDVSPEQDQGLGGICLQCSAQDDVCVAGIIY